MIEVHSSRYWVTLIKDEQSITASPAKVLKAVVELVGAEQVFDKLVVDFREDDDDEL